MTGKVVLLALHCSCVAGLVVCVHKKVSLNTIVLEGSGSGRETGCF